MDQSLEMYPLSLKVLRKQCAAFPDEESAGNKYVDPACSLHLDGWAAMRSVPHTFSREDQCALRNHESLWHRNASSPGGAEPCPQTQL